MLLPGRLSVVLSVWVLLVALVACTKISDDLEGAETSGNRAVAAKLTPEANTKSPLVVAPKKLVTLGRDWSSRLSGTTTVKPLKKKHILSAGSRKSTTVAKTPSTLETDSTPAATVTKPLLSATTNSAGVTIQRFSSASPFETTQIEHRHDASGHCVLPTAERRTKLNGLNEKPIFFKRKGLSEETPKRFPGRFAPEYPQSTQTTNLNPGVTYVPAPAGFQQAQSYQVPAPAPNNYQSASSNNNYPAPPSPTGSYTSKSKAVAPPKNQHARSNVYVQPAQQNYGQQRVNYAPPPQRKEYVPVKRVIVVKNARPNAQPVPPRIALQQNPFTDFGFDDDQSYSGRSGAQEKEDSLDRFAEIRNEILSQTDAPALPSGKKESYYEPPQFDLAKSAMNEKGCKMVIKEIQQVPKDLLRAKGSNIHSIFRIRRSANRNRAMTSVVMTKECYFPDVQAASAEVPQFEKGFPRRKSQDEDQRASRQNTRTYQPRQDSGNFDFDSFSYPASTNAQSYRDSYPRQHSRNSGNRQSRNKGRQNNNKHQRGHNQGHSTEQRGHNQGHSTEQRHPPPRDNYGQYSGNQDDGYEHQPPRQPSHRQYNNRGSHGSNRNQRNKKKNNDDGNRDHGDYQDDHQEDDGQGGHQGSRKPKMTNRSFAYYKKDTPKTKDPKNDEFSEEYASGNYKSYSSDYDSERDGPENKNHNSKSFF